MTPVAKRVQFTVTAEDAVLLAACASLAIACKSGVPFLITTNLGILRVVETAHPNPMGAYERLTKLLITGANAAGFPAEAVKT